MKREPILGVSVYDERNLRKKTGRRFKNIDNFVTYKEETSEPSGYEYQAAKDIHEPCIWRDKLNIHIDMGIEATMQGLWKCFLSMNSFDIDPDQPDKLLEEREAYGLKKSVDRALRWLV